MIPILLQTILDYLTEAGEKRLFPRWLLRQARFRAMELARLAARRVVESGKSPEEAQARVRKAIGEVLANWRWQRRRYGRPALFRMRGRHWRSTLPAMKYRECWPFNAPDPSGSS